MTNPKRTGPDILLPIQSLTEPRPVVTGLADGRFLVAWTANASPNPMLPNTDVRAQVFDAAGKPWGAMIEVNAVTAMNQGGPAVAGLADGRFAVVWRDDSQQGADTSSGGIRLQIYGADGARIGAQAYVNTSTLYTQHGADITALSDGRFVVAWSDYSGASGDGSAGDVRAQVFNADGTRSGGELLINTSIEGGQQDVNIAALKGGGFVATWVDNTPSAGDPSDTAVRAQVFGANGARVGNEFLVNTTTASFQSEPDITALAGGGFVITWMDGSRSGEPGMYNDIRAQVYAADGTRAGAEIVVNTTTADEQQLASITALSDGRFVVTWTDYDTIDVSAVIATIRAQVFDAEGNPAGTEFALSAPGGFNAYSTITELADGRLAVFWTEMTGRDSVPLVDLRGQILDPRLDAVSLSGSAAADRYIGTGFGDRMAGARGDDWLEGRSGDDRLGGGDGRDRLDGGAGGDRLWGEGGRDSLSGGSGDDRLAGGAGADTLTGGAGRDRFVFDSAAGARGDVITDFRPGVDVIDLRGFMRGGDFIGAARFTGEADQVRYDRDEGILRGDVNGDGRADWTIRIANEARLTDDDFLF